MMSVDETLMCSFQILKPADKKKFPYGGLNAGRPVTPPRGATQQKAKKKWIDKKEMFFESWWEKNNSYVNVTRFVLTDFLQNLSHVKMLLALIHEK